jgi:hypothetical protein
MEKLNKIEKSLDHCTAPRPLPVGGTEMGCSGSKEADAPPGSPVKQKPKYRRTTEQELPTVSVKLRGTRG